MYGTEYLLDWTLKTRTGRLIVSSVTLPLCATLAVYLLPVMASDFRLTQSSSVVSAHVIGSNISEPHELFSSKRYILQYQFHLHGDTYYKRRPFGNAWSRVSKEVYDKVTRSSTIDVLYQPADPWNNDLAANASWLWWQAVAWTGGLAVAMIASGIWWVRVVKRDILGHREEKIAAGPRE